MHSSVKEQVHTSYQRYYKNSKISSHSLNIISLYCQSIRQTHHCNQPLTCSTPNTSGMQNCSMFCTPCFRVTIELGQLLHEPCIFSFTMPSSKPFSEKSFYQDYLTLLDQKRNANRDEKEIGIRKRQKMRKIWAWKGDGNQL